MDEAKSNYNNMSCLPQQEEQLASFKLMNGSNDKIVSNQVVTRNGNLNIVSIDKHVPSSENWFHGKLERSLSEKYLIQANTPGSFLIRESKCKPCSFVLSYFSYKSVIYHFKITPVFGDYYIGGRQFNSLDTLISYYMFYSELLKGEKLLVPIAPACVCKLEKIYVSVKKHLPTHVVPHANVVSLNDCNEDILYIDKIGELFKVFHEVGEGEWLWAQALQLNDFNKSEYGLLLADCVRQVDDDKLHEYEPWYYSDITKEDAINILANLGNLSYLIRPSDQSPGDYTLFFNADNVVHRFRITTISKQVDENNKLVYFHIGGRDFTSISSIVDRYMNEDITEGYRLTKLPHKRYQSNQEENLDLNDEEQEVDADADTYDDQDEQESSNNDLLKMPSETDASDFIESKNSSKHKPVQTNSSTVSITSPYHSFKDLKLLKRNSITAVTNGKSTSQDNGKAISIGAKTKNQVDNLPNYCNLMNIQSNEPNNFSQSYNESSILAAKINIDKIESKKKNALKKSQPSSKSNVLIKTTSTPAPKSNHFSVTKSFSSPLTSFFFNSNSNNSNNNKSDFDLGFHDSLNKQQIISSQKQVGPEILSKKSDKIILKGCLNKYNEKTKKWKAYWFSLNQTSHQLFYFSNDKKLKEKGLIDLTYGFYYPIDDSFFNKPFCFQIIIHSLGETNGSSNASNHMNMLNFGNNSIVHYLCAEDLQSFKEWTENIRPLCNAIQYNPFVSKSFSSSISSLSLSSLSSSSPLNTSLSLANETNQPQPPTQTQIPLKALNESNKLTCLSHHAADASIAHDHQNYRVLRTLNVEIHEAHNVCFSPILVQQSSANKSLITTFNSNDSTNTTNGQIINSSTSGTNSANSSSNTSMPKYHKENLYYCLLLFNNDVNVASTRVANSNSNQSKSSCSSLSSTTANSLNNSSNFTVLSSDLTHQASKHCLISKDAIWDDSFSFDNLPLDVKELKICLYVIAKPSNFSASSIVNNLKKISNSNTTSKMLDPMLIGTVSIRLEDLTNKGLCESWYKMEPNVHVNTINNSNEVYGDTSQISNNGSISNNLVDVISNNCTIRVKIRFCEEKINLNRSNYQDLADYLTDENEHKNLSSLYESIMPSTERPHLVQALLRFFIVEKKIVEMLNSFLITDIDRCTDLSTLFRPATISTSLMDHYMRVRCDRFLRKAIEEPLARILKHSLPNSSSTSSSSSSSGSNIDSTQNIKSFELDPSKCPDQQQREQNLSNFQQALQDLINSICDQSSINLFPNELKHLFYNIKKHVQLKWQSQKKMSSRSESLDVSELDQFVKTNASAVNITADDKLVKIYCVSAFVFLRLMCPALLNSKNFGLKFFNFTSKTSANKTTPSNIKKEKADELIQLDYYDLAVQFSVFSPSFMFSLSPINPQINTTCVTHASMSQASTLQPSTSSSSSTTTHSIIQNTSIFERHIKLLAKVLQTLANMTECKEPFMMPLSEFLNTKKANIIKFIDDISNLNEFKTQTNDSPNNNNNENENEEETTLIEDLKQLTFKSKNKDERKQINDEIKLQFEHSSCKYLAIIHRLLNSLVPQMKSYITKSQYDQQQKLKDAFLISDDLNSTNESSKQATRTENSTSGNEDDSFINSLQKLIKILTDINIRVK